MAVVPGLRVMLVGLAKKNGIMMIDFALEAQREGGKPPREGIYEACLIRFRPIMMTAMSALMSTLPIAIGFGTGSEVRRPLGPRRPISPSFAGPRRFRLT